MQIVGQTWLSLVTLTCGSWSEGPVILPYILKNMSHMYIILWDYESVWTKVWPKNKCRSLWPIFYGPVILPYILKTIWCINIIIWYYESVWPEVWPQNNCRSLGPVFHGPVILYYILKTINFDVWTTLFGIMNQNDPTFDLKIIVGHCDLCFMAQWFWRLFDVWTSYFGIQYDQTFDLKVTVMVQWFCLISWRLFDACTLYFGIMNQFMIQLESTKLEATLCTFGDLYHKICGWKPENTY